MEVHLRVAHEGDFEFAFDAKCDAMGPHIRKRWGWDDAFQRDHHRRRWEEKRWYVIEGENDRIGTVAIDITASHVQFGEFYILGTYRNQGVGTHVLRYALSLADERQLETRLEYLKWNPVGTLYARHGFEIRAENEIHYFLVRPPAPKLGKLNPA
ncbi:MAG: GNAT family N-acetyltransferase [Pseudomonadota bacterium]